MTPHDDILTPEQQRESWVRLYGVEQAREMERLRKQIAQREHARHLNFTPKSMKDLREYLNQPERKEP